MVRKNGAQTVDTVAGRRIVVSAGVGKTNIDELTMTKKFVEAGCKAFAFAEGTSVMLKVQAQKNTERSQTGVAEGHFATVDEALNWLKTEMKL